MSLMRVSSPVSLKLDGLTTDHRALVPSTVGVSVAHMPMREILECLAVEVLPEVMVVRRGGPCGAEQAFLTQADPSLIAEHPVAR